MRILSFCTCLFVFLLHFHTACSADEIHHYREASGKSVKAVTWRLQRGDKLVLSYSTPTERHVTTTGQSYATTRWEVIDSVIDTDLVATRRGETITVQGRLRGETICKTLPIDATPWYQATSLSLRELIASSDSERIFWTIRLDTLTVHKLRAAKKGIERVESDGRQEQLQRIRMRPTGALAPFWKCDYWFTLTEPMASSAVTRAPVDRRDRPKPS